MPEIQMGAVERRFAEIIWRHAPLTAAQIAKYALEELGWKKTTSYTALKRLCDKGIFANESGMVRAVISREEFDSLQSQRFVNDSFQGSLPAFIAAFARQQTLSGEELAQIRQLLDAYEREGEK